MSVLLWAFLSKRLRAKCPGPARTSYRNHPALELVMFEAKEATTLRRAAYKPPAGLPASACIPMGWLAEMEN